MVGMSRRKLGLPSRAQSVAKLRLRGDCYQLLMRSMGPWGCWNSSSIRILLLIPLIIDHMNRQKRNVESLAFNIRVLRREHISPALLLCWLLGPSPPCRQWLLASRGCDDDGVLVILILIGLMHLLSDTHWVHIISAALILHGHHAVRV